MTLVGIKIYPHIGVTSEERSFPQECHADLTLWGHFADAAATDDLEQSIDYRHVLAAVKNTVAEREYSLMETLAYAIVRDVLRNFPVLRVGVKLRKRPASMVKEIDFIEVEVEES